jgi:hypothetical protein
MSHAPSASSAAITLAHVAERFTAFHAGTLAPGREKITLSGAIVFHRRRFYAARSVASRRKQNKNLFFQSQVRTLAMHGLPMLLALLAAVKTM